MKVSFCKKGDLHKDNSPEMGSFQYKIKGKTEGKVKRMKELVFDKGCKRLSERNDSEKEYVTKCPKTLSWQQNFTLTSATDVSNLRHGEKEWAMNASPRPSPDRRDACSVGALDERTFTSVSFSSLLTS